MLSLKRPTLSDYGRVLSDATETLLRVEKTSKQTGTESFFKPKP